MAKTTTPHAIEQNGTEPEAFSPPEFTQDECRFLSSLLQTPEVCAVLVAPQTKGLAANIQAKLG